MIKVVHATITFCVPFTILLYRNVLYSLCY